MLVIQLAVILDIPLAFVHERWPELGLLPLGGGEFAQIGWLVTSGYVLSEIIRLFGDWKGRGH